jgi:hypothetical protein
MKEKRQIQIKNDKERKKAETVRKRHMQGMGSSTCVSIKI